MDPLCVRAIPSSVSLRCVGTNSTEFTLPYSSLGNFPQCLVSTRLRVRRRSWGSGSRLSEAAIRVKRLGDVGARGSATRFGRPVPTALWQERSRRVCEAGLLFVFIELLLHK
jgi:hypothetical protein